jgi:hypothetical protein
LSTTKPEKLSKALSDDTKTARQILNAAKRSTKPKSSGSSTLASSSKGRKPTIASQEITLPDPIVDVNVLSDVTIVTNRAPLVLAFALVALSFSPLPVQPVISRLSLAQGVVALNSRTKAAAIGIEPGKTAEEEGWGDGFGRFNVLGREVRTTRRTDVEVDSNGVAPVLAVDLEALRKRDFSYAPDANFGANVPIHTPHAARNYLQKSFDRLDGGKSAKDKEENAAMVLGALELAMRTWKEEEVHMRAWQGYIKIRPAVANGVEGWGAKGQVKLKDILDLGDGDVMKAQEDT